MRETAAGVLGRSAAEVAQLWRETHERSAYLGSSGALAWGIGVVDVALWDLRGHQLGLPLWQLLGGERRWVPAYRSGGYINASIDELLAEWAAASADGYRGMKMRVDGGAVRTHRDRVKELRQSMGPDPDLMVEASHALEPTGAADLARAIEPFDVRWLEEPFADDDLEAYAQLGATTSIPLAMGEHHFYAEGVQGLIDSPAVDIVQPDIIRLGGISEWPPGAAVATERDRPLAPHFYREIDVSLTALAPTVVKIEDFDWLDRWIAWDVEFVAGRYRPTHAPGLGITLRDELGGDLVTRLEVTPTP